MKKKDHKTYWELFVTFVKIGLLTIGGGYAMLPMMQGELVDKKKWIDEEELLDYYAVGQSTPGIIAVNVATFVGFKKKKVLGGIIATLGIITPSLVIIMILASLISSIDQYPMVQKAMGGINVAVCALITDACLNFLKKTCKGVLSIVILLCSFSAIYFFKIPSFVIVLSAAILGIVVYFIKKKIDSRKKAEAVYEQKSGLLSEENENGK